MLNKTNNNISSRVLEVLRKDIILRKYPSNTFILETKLAEYYHVSRGSIRVALRSLINEGIIEATQTGRKKIVEINVKTIENMYELREWLELKAVNIITQDKFIKYSKLLKIFSQIEDSNKTYTINDYYKLDISFHRTLVEISDNRAILQAWETLASVIYTLLIINASYDYKKRYVKEFADKHKKIVDLIIRRDPKCNNILKMHIEDAKKITINTIEEIIQNEIKQ